jgi:hypothetical protein
MVEEKSKQVTSMKQVASRADEHVSPIFKVEEYTKLWLLPASCGFLVRP